MKLLLVAHLFPLPAHDGGRIAFFNTVKHLARVHEVGVICLAGRDEDAPSGDLEKHCSYVHVFRRKAHTDKLRILRGMLLDPPGAGSKYWYPAAGELIRKSVRAQRPEVVEFHHLNMAVYRTFAEGVPTVLREHNVEYKVWERYARGASGMLERTYAKWTAPRLRRYEAEVASRFDRCVVVSPADAGYLRAVSPSSRIEVVPFGIDTEYFYPLLEVPEEPCSITITGSFDWGPKQQSLHTLLTRVFPSIRAHFPEAKLYVVGRGVSRELKEAADKMRGVVVTGPVADVRPHIARSSLLINYMESGGGIAIKVLEAMAMRKPVLCNSLGCEGIPVTRGQDVFVADGAEEFATAAVWLLRDESARARIAEGGYRRVLEEYSWQVITGRLGRVYEALRSERGTVRPVVELGQLGEVSAIQER